MNLLLNAISGTVVGILMTIPLGPISFYVAQKTLNHETRKAMYVASGSVLIDIVYCLVITLGLMSLLAPLLHNEFVQMGLCVVLAVYGIKMLVVDTKRPTQNGSPLTEQVERNHHLNVFLGISIAAANPTLIVSWTAVISFVSAQQLLGPTVLEKIVFSFATGFGSLLWFVLLALFVRSRRHSISQRFIKTAGVITAVVIIGFAVYFSIHVIRNMAGTS